MELSKYISIKKIQHLYKKNNKGLSLVEVTISVVLTALVLIAIIYFFNISLFSIKEKNNLLKQNSLYESEIILKNILKDSHFNNSDGNPSSDTYINSKSFAIKTSYFSNTEKNDLYTFTCNDSDKTITYKINDNLEKNLFSNVQSCNITYYETDLEETLDQSKTVLVKINASYIDDKNKQKNINIYQKLMQEY